MHTTPLVKTRRTHLSLIPLLMAMVIALLGLGSVPASALPAPEEPGAVVGGAMSRSEVITRAHAWYQLRERIPYSQEDCYLTGVGSVDIRWSAITGGCFPSYYRTDCAGFVSMALNATNSFSALPPGEGLTRSDVSRKISKNELKPGDFLMHFSDVHAERHTQLFDRWVDAGKTSYWAYDFGAYPVKHRKEAWTGWYTPYRYLKIVDDPGDNTVFYQEPNTALPVGVSASMVRNTDYRLPLVEISGGSNSDGFFTTWGDVLNVRRGPSTSGAPVTTIRGGSRVRVSCQTHGQRITADGITNDAWAYLPDYGGWITNIYLQGPAWMPGVPTCSGTQPGSGATFTTWGDVINVRQNTTTASSVVTTVKGGTPVRVSCQARGQRITADGITNDAWSYLPDYGGWITNIYLQGPAWMPGVPTCI
ncbi:SH3 domain-containing protein [Streptomyces purpureus]|uniref:Uncharacterized protein n=1 Tax=Streptomyces purpureus TaxID=1951 RepID=A0A918HCS8_9ACTN|nr:SH3 domain-containing protein [Streptomyces purpureus]GGT53766.1 hypothetical protein GCM10014713_54560 [Streptomyces purpureus]